MPDAAPPRKQSHSTTIPMLSQQACRKAPILRYNLKVYSIFTYVFHPLRSRKECRLRDYLRSKSRQFKSIIHSIVHSSTRLGMAWTPRSNSSLSSGKIIDISADHKSIQRLPCRENTFIRNTFTLLRFPRAFLAGSGKTRGR